MYSEHLCRHCVFLNAFLNHLSNLYIKYHHCIVPYTYNNSLFSIFNFYFINNYIFDRFIHEISLYMTNSFHYVHAFYYFTKNSMMTIKPWSFI